MEPELTLQKSRQFRILSALAILFVVSGHTYGIGIGQWCNYIPYYSFHVPLFVFISGYFYKSAYEDNLFLFIKKKFLRLLVPLWLWSFAYGVFANYLGGYFLDLKPAPLDFYNVFWASLYDGHQYVFNFASWFIGPLFFAYVIVAFMRKYIFSKLGGNACFLYLDAA